MRCQLLLPIFRAGNKYATRPISVWKNAQTSTLGVM